MTSCLSPLFPSTTPLMSRNCKFKTAVLLIFFFILCPMASNIQDEDPSDTARPSRTPLDLRWSSLGIQARETPPGTSLRNDSRPETTAEHTEAGFSSGDRNPPQSKTGLNDRRLRDKFSSGNQAEESPRGSSVKNDGHKRMPETIKNCYTGGRNPGQVKTGLKDHRPRDGTYDRFSSEGKC